jgi:hypothetical protein
LGIGVLIGQAIGGLALAVGLFLGAANGYAADRMLAVPISYILSSLGRIALFSVAALALAFAIGWRYVWLVLVGLGLAQFVLVGISLKQAARL